MPETRSPEAPDGDPLLHPEQVAPPRSRLWLKWFGYVVGLALLGACVAVAVIYTDFSPLKQAQPMHVALLCLLIALSLSCNAALFQLSMHVFKGGQGVSTFEWQTLMAASAPLNYLPKAGMLGRVAYLKARHGITLQANMLCLFHIAAGTTGVYTLLTIVTLWREAFDPIWFASVGAGLLLGTAVSPPLIRWTGRGELRRIPGIRLLAGCLIWYLLRFGDTFLFAARVYLSAVIFQIPLDLPGALLVGVVCNTAVMVAPVPGAAGIREWLGALLLSSGAAGEMTMAQGIGLLLVDRGAEVFVFLSLGLPALVYLHRRKPGPAQPQPNSEAA